MDQKPDSFTSTSIGIACFVACFTAVALIVARFIAFPAMSQLHFSPYGLISVLSATGTFVILLRMMLHKGRSEETTWFMLVLLGQVLFAGSEAMQRFSLDGSSAIFWTRMGGAGASLIGVGVFLFAIAYTRPARYRPAIIASLFLFVTVIVTVFYSEGSLLFNANPSQLTLYHWGFNNAPGKVLWVSLVWVALPGILSGLILLKFRSKTTNQLLRKQSLLFATAILVPIIAGLTTDGLLPLLHVTVLPPLGTLFELVTCVVIFYGISRYQFFQVNPAVLAENVLTTMHEAVVVTHGDFTVEYINKEAERLLKVTNEKLPHTLVHSLFSPDSWPKIHAYIRGDVPTDQNFGDLKLVTPTGEEIPVRVFISTLQEGSFQAYVFVISDISDIVLSYNKLESDATRIRGLLDESHRLEQQLEAEKNGIEKIVEQRTQELRNAQEQLKESDKLKTEFIMLGSHNLRTPITIMASSLEMLEQTQDDKERQTYMDSLAQGINRLKDFVEDMVAIGSLEAGNGLKRVPITVASLLGPLVAEAKAFTTTKPAVTFSADIQNGDTITLANNVRLQGAIRNVINNAFKFTQAGGITLTGHIAADNYLITIHDTGIGINNTELDKLFTKFHRGTGTLTYEYEGEGIGLYLTKLIIDEHDGTISVESTIGAGSTFTISLPIQK